MGKELVTSRKEHEALTEEYVKAKSLVAFLLDNDVNQQMFIMKCISDNEALKRD